METPDLKLVKLTNSRKARCVISTLGAGVVVLEAPDSQGYLSDVVLGYSNASDYLNDGPCAGKIPGRYANRIARGRFSLNGKTYSLTINNGPNALHGGPTGFQNRIWDIVEETPSSVTLQYISADGEEGYPGELTVTARYWWSDDFSLTLELSATTTKPTVINLSNHSYFNLSGHNAGSVLAHTLQLNASRWLPTDDTLIPSGELAPVADTPMDFTVAKALGRDIHMDFPALHYGKGYDYCFVLDDNTKPAAVLTDPASGRRLEVFTNQPGIQIYTGNWLDGCPAGKDGATYHDYDGVALECQDLPDAPNHPAFPSTQLNPGEKYSRKIIFKFTTK